MIAKTSSIAIQNIIGIYSIKFSEDQFLCSSLQNSSSPRFFPLQRLVIPFCVEGESSRGEKEEKGESFPEGYIGESVPPPYFMPELGMRDLGCLVFEESLRASITEEGDQCSIAAGILISFADT